MLKINLHKPFILFLIFISVNLFSQKEVNTWYFGMNAGLDFNSGSPQALLNGKLNTSEGCSSTSDSSGNLLFYTDGMKVWNKQHSLMPNGTGLKGNNSTTQSALIVQKPGSNTIYYIFTIGTIVPFSTGGSRELCLNELDISLNGGLGDLTKKNILLNSASCEKITGIRHCDGKNIWIVTHDWGSNTFRTFLINSSGVSLNPVLSNCGISASGFLGNSIGMLKGSPNGTKLASAIEGFISSFELFNFNSSTGEVSNPMQFPSGASGCYGVEFSPDGTKLYGGTYKPTNVYQFDLTNGSQSAIAQSSIVVGSENNINILLGTLQLGPDKKIYVARGAQPYLGVIKDPDRKGAACNYVKEGFAISHLSTYGLPNYVTPYSKPAACSFTYNINCMLGVFTSQQTNEPGTIMPVSWNFGDPESNDNITSAINPIHLFSKPGTYYVTLKFYDKCSEETIIQKIVIEPPQVLPANISGDKIFCFDNNATLTTNISGTYLWNTGDTAKAIIAQPGNGHYSVIITTSAGCTYTAAKSVTVHPPPVVICAAYNLTEMSAKLVATGGSTYQWYPADGLDCATCDKPIANYAGSTTYCVRVTDDNGCSGNSCVELQVSSIFIPNAFTPNEDALNETFLPVVNEVHEYKFLIFDKWGEKLFESSDPEKGWDGFYNGKMCPQNVYVYKLTFMDNEKNLPHEYAGKVALIR